MTLKINSKNPVIKSHFTIIEPAIALIEQTIERCLSISFDNKEKRGKYDKSIIIELQMHASRQIVVVVEVDEAWNVELITQLWLALRDARSDVECLRGMANHENISCRHQLIFLLLSSDHKLAILQQRQFKISGQAKIIAPDCMQIFIAPWSYANLKLAIKLSNFIMQANLF